MPATKAMTDAELADWLVEDGERGDAEARRRASRAEATRGNGAGSGDVARAVVVPLSSVAPERVDWLAPGLPLGKLVIVEGDPGTSKSTVALDIASRVTRGWPLPGGTPRLPRNVVLLTYEDGLADTIRPRLDALGGDPGRVFVFDAVDEDGDLRPPKFPADAHRLQAVVEQHAAALVIVDPLAAALDEQTDSHKDASVRRVTAQLARVAELTGACVIGIRHLTKGPATNALRAGGGSIAFIAAARVAILVSLHPDDADKPQHERRRVLACVKNNLAAHPPSRVFELWQPEGLDHAAIRWLGESTLSADDLNAAHAAVQPDDHTGQADRADWLRDLLAPGRMSFRDVLRLAKEAGFSERSLRRSAASLGVRIDREGHGTEHRTYWSLPTPATSATGARGAGATEVAAVSPQDAKPGPERTESPQRPDLGTLNGPMA